MRWKAFSWLFMDMTLAACNFLEQGLACANLATQAHDKDVFSLEAPDMRDPQVRLQRLQASLSKAAEGRRKGPSKLKLSSKQKTALRARAVAAKHMCRPKQRKEERAQYLQSCRRTYASSCLAHVAFDAGRVGARKRVLYCVMDNISGLASWAPPIRMRDSQYRLPDRDCMPSSAEQALLEAKTLEFLQGLREIDEAGNSKQTGSAFAHPPGQAVVNRHASYEQVLGLDHCLRTMFPSLSKGLLSFEPMPAALSAATTAHDPRRLPTLCITSDAGSDTQACVQFLQYGLSLRMAHFWEPRHRLARELENSANQVKGLRASLVCAEMVLNFSRGPRLNHRWFRILQEECVDYLGVCAEEPSALLRHFLPGVARECGIAEADLSIEQAHQLLQQARFLKVRGPSQTSRWDNFHSGWGERRKELSLQTLLLVSFGVKTGYLNAKSATAKYSEANLPKGEDAPETMSGETKAALFKRCRNKLHCVTLALLNQDLIADIESWYLLSRPISEALHETRTKLKGPSGTREVLLQEALGGSVDVANQVLEQLMSHDTWEAVGLWFGHKLQGSFVRRLKADDPLCRLQDERWQKLQAMALAIVQQKLQYASVALYCYPQKLILLACGVEKQQNECLVHLHMCYHAHQKAAATNTKWCRAFCKKSPFQLQIMKDVTAALDASNWQITKELVEWLRSIFSGFGATWCEEGFGKARAREQAQNMAHEMSDIDAWQTLTFNGVLPSAGFEEVVARASEFEADWPASLFHIQHRNASDKLRKITGTQNWPSLTQQSLCGAACELSLLVNAVQAGSVHRLSLGRTRCSGLICERNVEKRTIAAWLHCAASVMVPAPPQHWPMAWKHRLSPCTAGWKIARLSTDTMTWAQVHDFQEWLVCPCEIRSPLSFFAKMRVSSEALVPAFCNNSASAEKPLLQHVAENGFYDISESILKLLLQEEFGLHVQAKEDHLLGDLLLQSVTSTLRCTELEATDILEKSVQHRHKHNEELIELLKLPAFAELISSDDQEQVEASVKAAKASEKTLLSVGAAIRRVRAKSGKAKSKAAKRKPVSFASTGTSSVCKRSCRPDTGPTGTASTLAGASSMEAGA
ncbi:unnamed protein product [Effrenium voratum]|nr:unnamed protein product [Effrenium voratum]